MSRARTRGALARGAAAAIALALLAACARASEPVVIPADELPFVLGERAEPPEQGPEKTRQIIYLVRRERLQPVRRIVPADVPTPEAVVRALFAGPTRAERQRRITSEIPPGTQLLRLVVAEEVAEVDVGNEFERAASHGSFLLRVAQVVWTLVRLPEVSAVRFAINGVPISVVTDRGSTVDRPVSTPDYASIAPR